jgi:uncharacterized protein
MWIEREISSELSKIAQSFPVLVLIGPRQVGKTSILERTFPEYSYVSLDVGTHSESAETRPEEFLLQHPPPIVLDEIQYAPSFFRHIKTYVDAHRGEKGLFIITGSQNFMLMEAVADSLAGRAAIIPFLGLSAAEWETTRKTESRLEWKDFIWRGGFPALWSEPDITLSRDRWYQGYVATYLERDIRNLIKVGSLRDFERFIRACAARCSQTLNLSEIGRDVGISTTTSKQWLSVLQASNQVFLLEPYYRSLGKRLVKSPKLYFTDTGLASYLMAFGSSESLWASRQAGALWENHVINQWIRWRDWHEPSLGLWYWRDQTGNEVDLLIEKNQTLVAVECKLSEKPESKDLKGIRALKKFYGEQQVNKAYVACTIASSFDLEANVTAISGWKVWTIT